MPQFIGYEHEKEIINNYYFNQCYSKQRIVTIIIKNVGMNREDAKALVNEAIKEYRENE